MKCPSHSCVSFRMVARLLASSFCLLCLTGIAGDWPRFRGPNGSGVSEARGLPVEFGLTKKLIWKVDAPAGNSSPIIANDRVFLTGYKEDQRLVRCFNRKNGAQLWERSIGATRIERKSEPNDAASSTPVTDGRNLYALFSGFGLVSYALDGSERWRTPLEPFAQ